jgi:hypothetical protein
MKPGHTAAYQIAGQWLTGEIIRIYSSGMVVMDAAMPDRSRHCIMIDNLHPPF